jgi:hypothetical protein
MIFSGSENALPIAGEFTACSSAEEFCDDFLLSVDMIAVRPAKIKWRQQK